MQLENTPVFTVVALAGILTEVITGLSAKQYESNTVEFVVKSAIEAESILVFLKHFSGILVTEVPPFTIPRLIQFSNSDMLNV